MMWLKKVYRSIVAHWWKLAIIENSIKGVIENEDLIFINVKYPFLNRWYADPFILDYDDQEIILLVEDFSDTVKKGKISKLVIDRKSMRIKDVRIILELDSHLSFPVIERREDAIYIYPENGAASTLDLYEYNIQTEECKRVCNISDLSMADAVISCFNSEKFLFSTKGNGNVLDVYKFDVQKKFFNYYTNVTFKERIARNAGDFFEWNGNIYRAAQECNQMYGHAISLQKIDYKDGVFQMNEVRRILPPKGAFGIHTFNTYKGLTVVDLKVFRHPWIASPLFKLRNMFKRR